MELCGEWQRSNDARRQQLVRDQPGERREPDSAELTMTPENTVALSGRDAEKVLRLVEKLEELDDVQKVYANFDIDEAELERIADQ